MPAGWPSIRQGEAGVTSLAAQIIDQRVAGLVGQHGDAFAAELRLGTDASRRSAAFVLLVLRTVLAMDDEDALDCIVEGSGDFGVDGLHFEDPENGELAVTLVQGKYRQSLEGTHAFPENGIAKMIDAVGALFDPGRALTLNPRLRSRVEDVRSMVAEGAIPRVTAIAANNGPSWSAEAQQRIDAAVVDFGNQVAWQHVGPEALLALLQKQPPINEEMRLVGDATVETFDFRRVLTGRCPVAELARLTNTHGDHLFEKNIRRYLGLAGNRVNFGMASTLREPNERGNFYFYNNGVTIICSQFRYNALQQGNWRVQVDDLQIVNGGQTARTVQRVTAETGVPLDDAEVLVRIYELPPGDNGFVDAITFATNSQSPVDLRDLRANDPRQRALAESIRALGFDYRLKREERSVAAGEFTSALVAEAVLAVWRHRPHQAKFRRREHFGTLYDTIFKADLNGAQAVIAALALRQAENRRKRPPPELDAPDFLPYASRFVAMLLGQYVLDEMGIDLDQLDHRNFDQAKDFIERESSSCLSRAEMAIGEALASLFNGHQPTLQRLSATFRRADLVEMLAPPRRMG